MKKPIIFIVDDDAQVLKAISRDIKKQYRKAYRIVETTSANEALASLTEFKKRGEAVAMFLSDQRMDEMLGVDFLEQATPHFPAAKRVLLTAYSDTDAAIKAINEVNLDYYLMKPWDPPEERMYPVVDELLDDWGSTNQPEFQGIRIVGYQWSPRSHKIKDYLGGNLIPYRWLDLENSVEARELLDLHHVEEKSLPALFFEDGSFLIDPQLPELGEKLGKKSHAIESMYDVAIIGAGPAGLAAAVYGGSEGLKTLLIEKRAPGGQAGTSSRIENYLGFPSGLSGSDLARRAITQATRFGIEFLSPQEVLNIRLQDNYKILTLADQSEVSARSIVITTGVDYRRLPADNIDKFTGAGVYYGAATTEAGACKDQDVYIVGGGNSAGQGAMYLSKFARNVSIIIRKPDLSASMSQYLIDQIAATENIHVLPYHQIVAVDGDTRLEKLTLKDLQNKKSRTVDAGALFVFIGARPFTEWIDPEILRDPRGFIRTGRDLTQETNFREVWKLERQPAMLETSSPGIFAAGDVRSGAMNRVASAVGEGAMAIKFVHEYLATM